MSCATSPLRTPPRSRGSRLLCIVGPLLLAGAFTSGCSGSGGGGFVPGLVGDGGAKGDMKDDQIGIPDQGGNGGPCSNGNLDGIETDVDCGGGVCGKCELGEVCGCNADCKSNRCLSGRCMLPAASCMDGTQNSNETDVDCGGGECPTCANNKTCGTNSDCDSNSCAGGVCKAPTPRCDDNMKNGTEGDTDCGGSCGTKCANGQTCNGGGDCQSGNCQSGTCRAQQQQPSCSDSTRNGNETDIDCGGACPKCGINDRCLVNADCQTNICTSGFCAQPQVNGATCSESIDCFFNCVDGPCAMACIAAITDQSVANLWNGWTNCIATQCSSQAGGPCNQNNANYPASCDDCWDQKLFTPGGSCYNQFDACYSN